MPLYKGEDPIQELNLGDIGVAKAYFRGDLVFEKNIDPTPDLFTLLWGDTAITSSGTFSHAFDSGSAAPGRYAVVIFISGFTAGGNGNPTVTITDGADPITFGYGPAPRYIGTIAMPDNGNSNEQRFMIVPIPDHWSGSLTINITNTGRARTHLGLFVEDSYLEEVVQTLVDNTDGGVVPLLQSSRRDKILSSILMGGAADTGTTSVFADNSSAVTPLANQAGQSSRIKRVVAQRKAPNNETVTAIAASSGVFWNKEIISAAFSDYASRKEDRLPMDGKPLYWFRADKGALNSSGDPCADGDRVATWKNYGSYAQDATASNGPIYRTGGQGGMPYLEFDEANAEYFDDLTGIPQTSGVIGVVQSYAYAGVIELAASSDLRPVLGFATVQNAKCRLDFVQSTGVMTCLKTQFFRTDARITNGVFSFTTQIMGAASALRTYVNKDYLAVSSGSNPNATINTNVQFFRSEAFVPTRYFHGKVYELIMYPEAELLRPLGTSGLPGSRQLTNYLHHRYQMEQYEP